MTDPTPETTPARDEAVLRYYADTFCELGAHHECCGKLNKDECSGCLARSVLASAPAPASGRVDAVREALLGYVLKPGQYEMASAFARGQNRVAVDMLGVLDEASLSPAATPVSEAGGDCGWLVELKGTTPSWAILNPRDYDEHWTTDSTKAIRFAREADAQAYIDHIGWTEAFPSEHIWDDGRAVLAKPASSPAPVRPIGNQGISDYQREIARNMAEGFAAWNAARQEALPSDEPASSPAGGDVVQTLIDKTEKLIEAADDMGWSCNSSSADQAIREAKDAVRAALSQSTSAGRVG